jgi:clan AA aspartic protease
MGLTYADITLVNTIDIADAKRGLMLPESIRTINVHALVDSGAMSLVINKKIKEQLGLQILRTMEGELADGSKATCEVAGPVGIRFKNRETTCEAFVLNEANEVLLGVIPIEGMDVILDPIKEELILPPDRPNIARYYIK